MVKNNEWFPHTFALSQAVPPKEMQRIAADNPDITLITKQVYEFTAVLELILERVGFKEVQDSILSMMLCAYMLGAYRKTGIKMMEWIVKENDGKAD